MHLNQVIRYFKAVIHRYICYNILFNIILEPPNGL